MTPMLSDDVCWNFTDGRSVRRPLPGAEAQRRDVSLYEGLRRRGSERRVSPAVPGKPQPDLRRRQQRYLLAHVSRSVYLSTTSTSLCWVSYLGSQHDAVRCWALASTLDRLISAAPARAAANKLHVAAAIDRRDGQTDREQTDGRTPLRYIDAHRWKPASSVFCDTNNMWYIWYELSLLTGYIFVHYVCIGIVNCLEL